MVWVARRFLNELDASDLSQGKNVVERASALGCLGVAYAKAGQREETLEAYCESIMVRRPFARKYPQAFELLFFETLAKKFELLTKMGRADEMLEQEKTNTRNSHGEIRRTPACDLEYLEG